MAENRRVKITKMMIREAFLEILETTPFERITVSQICKEADVNRSTFYAYYNEPLQLLNEIEDGILEQIPLPQDRKAKEQPVYVEHLVKYFEYIKANERTFSLLLNVGDNRFAKHMMAVLFDKCFSKAIIEDSLAARVAYIFSANGCIGLTKDWINKDFPISPRAFAEMIQAVCYQVEITIKGLSSLKEK